MKKAARIIGGILFFTPITCMVIGWWANFVYALMLMGGNI